jgi:hypothetical protein
MLRGIPDMKRSFFVKLNLDHTIIEYDDAASLGH